MVKLKRSLKNLELDTNVAKKQAIPHFFAAGSKFCGKRAAEYCWPRLLRWGSGCHQSHSNAQEHKTVGDEGAKHPP